MVEGKKSDVRCVIEILTDGSLRAVDPAGNKLIKLEHGELQEYMFNKPIKHIETSPISTYMEINWRIVIIDGVPYRFNP